ncbi:hypothetical protein PENARI_c003G08530 [Penicillium arizonense]|uniref:Uncharacterized protein n=1 Tax=Penicillium arizonense TaxID=1835702 RepID=A0A1F5LS41_PENAI|nr:hypothetical protein PENARI_c003G08530 [Penicillium arizonense]OGE56028.1 hypothetical protein PENARI_c003G08530 [Penicillium arizonense]
MDRVISAETTTFAKAAIPIPESGTLETFIVPLVLEITRINVVEVFVGYLALASQYRHVLHLQMKTKNSDINPAQAVGKASDDPQSLAFAERSGKSPRNDAVNSTPKSKTAILLAFIAFNRPANIRGCGAPQGSNFLRTPTLCFVSFTFS